MPANPRKEKRLVIFGNTDLADIAYEYFTHDSPYEVVAFTVDRSYMTVEEKFGLPVVPFEDIELIFPPSRHEVFAAIWYKEMNRLRRDIAERAKAKQYRLASYISSKSSVWHNVRIGEHCFIFENNVIQPFASIGDNVIIWSASHIGHHVRIGSHCFISSGVIISGHASVEDYCFIGVNCTLSNFACVGEGSWVNLGACVAEDIPPHSYVRSVKSDFIKLNEKALFRAIALRGTVQTRK